MKETDGSDLTQRPAIAVLRIASERVIEHRAQPGWQLDGRLDVQRVAGWRFGQVGRQHGESRRDAELRAHLRERGGHERLVQLLPAEVRHPVFLAEELQGRRLLDEAVDPHPVFEPVSVQPSTGRDDDRVDLTGDELVREAGATIAHELEEVRTDRERRQTAKRHRDDRFSRQQALWLNARPRQPQPQRRQRERGMSIRPATDDLKTRPDRRRVSRPDRLQRGGATGIGAKTRSQVPIDVLGQGGRRAERASPHIRDEPLPVRLQRLEQQGQERRMPHRHQAQVRASQEEQQRHVAKRVHVLHEAHGTRHCERGIDEPFPPGAQVFRVFFEADGNRAGAGRAIDRDRCDRPIARSHGEPRAIEAQIEHPRCDSTAKFLLQRTRVRHPLRRRDRAAGQGERPDSISREHGVLAAEDVVNRRSEIRVRGERNPLLIGLDGVDGREAVRAAERRRRIRAQIRHQDGPLRQRRIVQRGSVAPVAAGLRRRPAAPGHRRRQRHVVSSIRPRSRRSRPHMRRPAAVRLSNEISVRHTSSSPRHQPGLRCRKNAT